MTEHEKEAVVMVDCLTRFMALAETYSVETCDIAARMLSLVGGDKDEVAMLGAAIDFINEVK